ncbi:MAG: RnfABCDGE type electron transport complex subunit D [Velocimicrobium sp.]
MNEMLNVSASPHVRSKDTTKSIMRDVAIAMIPTSVFGIYNFGINALLIILTCVATCVLAEYIYEKGMHRPITTGDFSAVVTGLILALNLPSSAPLWMAMIGSVFAIIIVKELFGGLGQNFMNPALAARCFLMISFTGRMTDFTVEKASSFVNGSMGIDGFSGATPLALVKAGESTDLLRMFIGGTAGTIGETSALCLLIGAAYLLIKKVITPRIPFIYIGTLLVFALIFGGHGFDVNYLLGELLGGGLIFGAFFMATDYVTSPITPVGQVVFAIMLGILTGIFRIFGGSAEGASYAIIIGNLVVPLIERITIPVAFGREGKQNGK